MKISFITTVLNEESTVVNLLNSLFNQSKIPDEIIIVDGGSTDSTLSVISNFIRSTSSGQILNKQIKLKIIVKKGNRSVGRNEAIKKSNNEVIVCSDAGCILDKDWVKNITKPFEDQNADVVAGYYQGRANSVFEKCLIPYVLVMPDKVKENSFLPATRSMAFKRSIWKKVGRFAENFSHNEDYVFAKKLEKINAKIIFEKNAIVYWRPRSNIPQAFNMFYRFAKGDSESRIFRPKVVLIFLRYMVGFALFFLFFLSRSYLILNTLYFILILYIFWSIFKNYKYVADWHAFFYLPMIQIVSDVAILLGTSSGLMNNFFKRLI